jgi:ABC-2 type transport system ATP-binding protein
MGIIELTDVTKRFGDVTALDEVSLEIEEGEIFGFLGPNGAGKSTTIDILLDFVRPTAGGISVLGADPQRDGLSIRRRVGVLPDGYHVYDRLTGRQHVQFAIDSKGSGEDPMVLLERTGIADAADRPAGNYSKGMRQRLVLAMALVGEPDLLILDEPSTGLDPAGAREFREIIREERDRGATVFFSSHILEQVEAVCDRVGILREGELVAVDTIDGLRASLGSETTLTVEVDAVPPSAVETLEGIPGVSGVLVDDTEVVIECAPESKWQIMTALEDLGATVRDFSTTETSLEDLFVAYTTGAEQPVDHSDRQAEVAQ